MLRQLEKKVNPSISNNRNNLPFSSAVLFTTSKLIRNSNQCHLSNHQSPQIQINGKTRKIEIGMQYRYFPIKICFKIAHKFCRCGLLTALTFSKGSFKNYVYKQEEGGLAKMSLLLRKLLQIVNFSTKEECG